MADGYTPKRTFKQKAKRFFMKLSLVAAFAAAVGGTGMNYYGSDQKIEEAKITSVDVIPAKSADDMARIIVHTDKGTFVNQPTRFLLKDKEDVDAISSVLKPGATVNLTVYGLNPHIGKYSRDDLKMFRNIIKVHLRTPPEQLPVPVPHIAGQPNTGVTPGRENWQVPSIDPALAGPFAEQDQTLPEATALNADLTAMAARTPELARDIATMGRLPITGAGIYNALKDPANGIQSTLFPVPKGEGSTSSYQNKQVRVARGAGTHTSFHEYFHAWQDMTHGQNTMFNLSMRDAVIANLLTESSAVAYEMASQREAQNHGIPYTGPRVYTEQQGNSTVTMTTKSPSSDPANIAAFNKAYDAAWAANADANAQTREANALAAGGQAVVRRLLDGQDASWRFTYVQVAVGNINNNLHAFQAKETDAGYAAKRDAVFAHEGRVSPQLNFVPAEYLGPDAAQQIEKTFNGMGFRIEKNSAENTPSYDVKPNVPAAKTARPSLG